VTNGEKRNKPRRTIHPDCRTVGPHRRERETGVRVVSRYTSGSMAAYVQKACHCRGGWMCSFCRRWPKPGNPKPKPEGADA
jgi:hypothetical protein